MLSRSPRFVVVVIVSLFSSSSEYIFPLIFSESGREEERHTERRIDVKERD